MAWRMVQEPTGMLARFSEVVDDFTDYHMTESEAINYCLEHMGRNDSKEKVSRAFENPGRFEECLRIIEAVHGKQRATSRRKLLMT